MIYIVLESINESGHITAPEPVWRQHNKQPWEYIVNTIMSLSSWQLLY